MKNKQTPIFYVNLILLLALLIGFSSGSLAKDSRLYLTANYPEDGEQKVATDLMINLEFNKNVVNMKVKERNQKSFKMFDEAGKIISLEIIMADDQLYREKRREIKIKPVAELAPDRYYTLVIHSSLMSKNGEMLNEPIYITFKTCQ